METPPFDPFRRPGALLVRPRPFAARPRVPRPPTGSIWTWISRASCAGAWRSRSNRCVTASARRSTPPSLIASVRAGRRALPHALEAERLRARSRRRSAWERATFEISYATKPCKGFTFVGPTEAEPDRTLGGWTQGQADDTHWWMPCREHWSRATLEQIVTVPTGYRVRQRPAPGAAPEPPGAHGHVALAARDHAPRSPRS